MSRCQIRLLGALLLLGVSPPSLGAEEGPIQPDKGGFQVHFPGYEAHIASDGCMTNLRIGDREFLAAGVSLSRGGYFFQGSVLDLGMPKRQGEDTIRAANTKATVVYTFTSERMTWTVTNVTDQPMSYFLVLPAAVGVVKSGDTYARTAVVKDWSDVTFYSGSARLALTGSTRLWGPWDGGTQVWDATLAAHESRRLTLVPGKTDDNEMAKLKALGVTLEGNAPPGANPVELTAYPEQDLNLVSPLPYQVFQRQTKLHGRLLISGWTRPNCDRIEARVTGHSLTGPLPSVWQAVPLSAGTHSFLTDLPTPSGGWYRVEVHALRGRQIVARAAVEHVGIGEVFLGAGQSNSTNCGQERTQQTSGMVSAFSGMTWQVADDPQPGVHDKSGGGSFWPAFGDAMVARYHVPIGVAVTGHGGTSVNQWQPDSDLFQWTLTRIYQFGPGGFRALLWHQGESDTGMSSEEYAGKLTNIIRTSQARAGWAFPWFVAQASYHNPADSSTVSIRDAQRKLWDLGVAQAGPDTDMLTGDNRDFGGKGIHFSPKGLLAHGKLWAAQVGLCLDRILAREK